MNLDEMTEAEVAGSVIRDSIKNVVFLAAALAVLIWLGARWPLVGTVGSWLFATLAAVNTLHVVMTVIVPGIMVPILARREGRSLEGQGKLYFASLVRIVEAGLIVWAPVFLFQRF